MLQYHDTMPLKSWGQIIFSLEFYTQSDNQVLVELLAMQRLRTYTPTDFSKTPYAPVKLTYQNDNSYHLLSTYIYSLTCNTSAE